MKILLLGANGQVGWELQRSLLPHGPITVCDRQALDLEDLPAVRAYIRALQPQIIVNAAAFTAVDAAESNRKTAHQINADAVEVLAQEAKALDAWLIHYSTDYVFDGTKIGAYNEEDAPHPLNVYGQTKLDGERLIQASGCKHLIFRTSWIYAARGSNFVRTMLRLAATEDQLNIVADQIGAPTSAPWVADMTAVVVSHITNGLSAECKGIYHLSAGGQTSWHGFAVCVIETARALGLSIKTTPKQIYPITTAEYPRPAARPAHSLLNTRKFCDTFSAQILPWDVPVKRVIAEYLEQGLLSYES